MQQCRIEQMQVQQITEAPGCYKHIYCPNLPYCLWILLLFRHSSVQPPARLLKWPASFFNVMDIDNLQAVGPKKRIGRQRALIAKTNFSVNVAGPFLGAPGAAPLPLHIMLKRCAANARVRFTFC
jgi:hypothetical protein